MKRIFKSRYFLGGICILLAMLLSMVIIPKHEKEKDEILKVIRVKEFIPQNTIIEKNMFRVYEIPQRYVPADSLLESDIVSIVGLLSSTNIFEQDFLQKNKFKLNDHDEFLNSLDFANGERAISITIKSLAAGVSGKLQKGDIVSIYAYLTEEKKIIADPTLSAIKVGAVVNSKAQNTDESGEDADIITAAMILLVNEEQAVKLVELEKTADFHVVYRGRENSPITQDIGIIQDNINKNVVSIDGNRSLETHEAEDNTKRDENNLDMNFELD